MSTSVLRPIAEHQPQPRSSSVVRGNGFAKSRTSSCDRDFERNSCSVRVYCETPEADVWTTDCSDFPPVRSHQQLSVSMFEFRRQLWTLTLLPSIRLLCDTGPIHTGTMQIGTLNKDFFVLLTIHRIFLPQVAARQGCGVVGMWGSMNVR